MRLAMPFVWDERCLAHDPRSEVWLGIATPAAETSSRIEAVRAALLEANAPQVEAVQHDDATLLAVHDPELVAYLGTAWDEWRTAGLPEDPGQDRVVPYVFAHAALTSGRRAALPTAIWARPGYFAYDTMTLVGPGTWDAIRGAVDAALTAVDLVVDGALCAYACCRPPGHHAGRSCFGGSCYLNNAAIAAAALLDRVGAPVAVLDIDAHHGNGTQEIFFERPEVLVGSVHVDPAAGWFPHFLGFPDETGLGAGARANRNVVLAPGAGDEEWLRAISELVGWIRLNEAKALVVSLGVDAATDDPESPLQVSTAGFRSAGALIGEAKLPTVLLQEGGYDLRTIGTLVREVLLGVEEGLA
jgi:acetoin utilization deacetylase AcuC-like enzyme